MSKLSKAQIKSHQRALGYLAQATMTHDEREFVFDNWQESANHINSAAGAFFTPLALAWDFAIDVGGQRILDLCAGIGALSYATLHYDEMGRRACGLSPAQITCVEINPDYVAVGRRLVPEAEWIVADVFELPDLGRFDWVISNPPFGKLAGKADFDLAVVERARDLADNATFILPAMSVPWAYSGRPFFDDRRPSEKARRFRERTGIELRPGCGVDCSTYRDLWRGTAPAVEIALADFTEGRGAAWPAEEVAAPAADQPDLFAEAA